jgi:hypothetical protein
MAKWGPFGQKKRWMGAHPGATEGEWEEWDREQWEKKRGARGKKQEDGGREE